MQLERIKGIYSDPISLLKTVQKSNVHRLFSFTSAVTCSLLLILVLTSFSYTSEDPVFLLQQKTVPERIAKVANPNDRAVEWLIHLIEIFLDDNNPSKLTQQLAISEQLWSNDYKHKEAIILLTKATIDQITGYDSTTIANIENAMQLLENSQISSIAEKKIRCLSYSQYARISKFFNKEKKGIEYGYKAIGLAAEIDFPEGEMLAHNQVAQLIGYNQNDMPLVLEHFTKAKSLTPRVSPNIRKLFDNFLTLNIANAQSALGQVEEALNIRLQLLEKNNEQVNPKLLISTCSAIGFDYFKLKDYDSAKKHLKKTVELMTKHNSYLEFKGIPLIRLSLISIEQENIPLAISYADTIQEWLKNYQFVGAHRLNYYHLKSKLAKANNDLEQAVQWLEKATAERDSLKTIIGPNKIIKLEEQSKFSEIQKERLALEKNRDKNKSTIYSQKILIVGGVIILLLIGYLYSYLHKQKKDIPNSASTKKSSRKKLSNIREKDFTSSKVDHELMQRIEISLQEEKLFLAQDFTLKKFADHLNSNTSYLSKTINEGFQKNFNALINDYRVEEVLRLFEEGEYLTFTIESIYQKAGFKSKSSFQKAFKSKTGITASHYLSNLKLNKSGPNL